jgi:hypothetical protein
MVSDLSVSLLQFNRCFVIFIILPAKQRKGILGFSGILVYWES